MLVRSTCAVHNFLFVAWNICFSGKELLFILCGLFLSLLCDFIPKENFRFFSLSEESREEEEGGERDREDERDKEKREKQQQQQQ